MERQRAASSVGSDARAYLRPASMFSWKLSTVACAGTPAGLLTNITSSASYTICRWFRGTTGVKFACLSLFQPCQYFLSRKIYYVYKEKRKGKGKRCSIRHDNNATGGHPVMAAGPRRVTPHREGRPLTHDYRSDLHTLPEDKLREIQHQWQQQPPRYLTDPFEGRPGRSPIPC